MARKKLSIEDQMLADVAKVMKRTRDPLFIKQASRFSRECPKCGSDRDSWTFDIMHDGFEPPIRECAGYDLVRYQCKKCLEVFTKIEITQMWKSVDSIINLVLSEYYSNLE